MLHGQEKIFRLYVLTKARRLLTAETDLLSDSHGAFDNGHIVFLTNVREDVGDEDEINDPIE